MIHVMACIVARSDAIGAVSRVRSDQVEPWASQADPDARMATPHVQAAVAATLSLRAQSPAIHADALR